MKIDLNYLNRFSKLEIKDNVIFNEEYFKNSEIRELKDINVTGLISIDYEEIFLSVAMLKSIRILLAIAAYHDYEI